MDGFFELFGDVFLMLFGGGRNVHVDNATLVKYCIFHALPPPEYELYLSDDFGNSLTFSVKKRLRKYTKNEFE